MGGCVTAVRDIIVNIDWLALSGRLSVLDTKPFLPSGWSAIPMGRTAVWGQRVLVMNGDGVKVGTFLFEPISPIIKADRAVLEVANVWLYRADFHMIMDELEKVYPFVVDGVQRVDVCGDFEMDSSRWEVAKMLDDGRAYVKGIQRGTTWWQSQKSLRVAHQLSWGGKDSTFKWKLYWKHKELWEGGTCSKPYIEDIWRTRGLDPKKVWRLECSLMAINQLDNSLFGRLSYREWFDRAPEVYRHLYGDKFVVRENQGHADKRHDDKLTFLEVYGDKVLKHRKPKNSEIENDVQRRIVCKLWKEFTDAEVRCDDFAMEGLRAHIEYMFQRVSNINAVCRRFKLTEKEVLNLLSS